MINRFECHAHSHYSNIRLLDCINPVDKLIKRAVALGLKGIALTDHEVTAGHPEANFLAEEIQKEYPDFKVALGNEIYLCETRELGQKYWHFILIAKNKTGQRAIRELSSRAWLNSFWDRGMERVVTLKSDLEEIVAKYPDSIIATSACLGGELSTAVLNMVSAENMFDMDTRAREYEHIMDFLNWCKKLFGADFYIECAPAASKDQIVANKKLRQISDVLNIPMVIGSDAHYLSKEDRYVHKAYLNSKGGEREVDSFYEYSYLQSEQEIFDNLRKSFNDDNYVIELFENSMCIYDKIENYSLKHKQQIPKVEVENYAKEYYEDNRYPTLQSLFASDNDVERYWVNSCYSKLEEIGKCNDTYLARLEEEARVKRVISAKLETNMFAYPVTLQHYVDMFWECGSIVGAGRGSSCSGLNHYLLGITQLDPIEWELPWWRYLNDERAELGDIDLDLCPSKRPLILKKIKQERGKNFNPDIDELSGANLGCTLIATFGTEGTKSAILTACRGYRSEEYSEGIDVDLAQYMASLVPQERGFLWSISDVVNGNPDKDRKPVAAFIREVKQYPGLLEIISSIEGLINKRSSHASGVIMFDEDPYEFGAFMRTPKGEVITQYDLHMCEAQGMTKYDFLVTEVQDKIAECIHLLQKDEVINPRLSLKEVYTEYLHPSILPIEEDKYWKPIQNVEVLNIFQFDSDVGMQAARKIKPSSILEMSDANGLMRLMTSEKGEETPMEKYVRFKNNINLWYKEMDEFGLTKEEQEVLKPYFLKSHGVPPSQEQMMKMLMDPQICNFSLAEANTARKIVGKKQMSKIPALQQQVLDQAASPCLGHYVWKHGIGPQMGYSFSIIHALAYSFIGFQTAYLATRWNPIYWNTACLIVNSGSLEGYESDDLDDDQEAKDKQTDYAKIAKALGEIISRGIRVSLIDINESEFSFKPDVKHNQIMFGLKALSGINSDVIEAIVNGRPYSSLADFMNRCPLNKTQMISLIKAGAFDSLEEEWGKAFGVNGRVAAMGYYLAQACEPKTKLTLQNFNGLIQRGLVPESLEFQRKVFEFNKYLKANTKVGKYFVFDAPCNSFYEKHFDMEKLEVINGLTCIQQKTWDGIYQKQMDGARDWLKEHQGEVLRELNEQLFRESWEKYAKGTVSTWEMDSLCFYYSEHELAHVDMYKYGIIDFFSLPADEPIVDYYFQRNGKQLPVYKTFKIIGTVICKNDTKATVTLLTTTGVVTVKFTKDYYAMFKKQISEKQEDGTKKVVEKGWFKRGNMLMVTGFRRGDQFVAKTYKNTPTHQLYLVQLENNGKDLILTHERADVEE